MQTKIFDNARSLGEAAGNDAALKIEAAINENHQANIILATGASQFFTLQTLVNYAIIDWSRVTVFHLDEYIGIDENHPASFRRYLKERFFDKIGKVRDFVFINGSATDANAECERLGRLIKAQRIDVALVGIGENGHLAFNDPPADFETASPYIIADLDEKCRMQQVGEGWFDELDEVPKQAISMSIKQIMKSRSIVCSVPDARKAIAVKQCVLGEVTNEHPASVLQQHAECKLFLDKHSAAYI
jgi:glucosamine-6-phosphate deaminase